jgi:putative inorganic carbon (HCO3(-)) transporter
MTPAIAIRNNQSSLFSLALVIGGALMLVIASSGDSGKVKAIALGVPAVLALFAFSGNPRLCLIWGYGLTMPLSLSKYFGQDTYKGGGETAYRIDASDLFIFMLGLCIIAEIWARRRPGLRIPRILGPWVLLMVWGLAAILGGAWRTTAAHETIRMIKMAITVIVLVNELERPRRMLHFVGALTLGGVANAGVGIAEYWFHRTFGLEFMGESDPHQINILATTSEQGAKVFRISGLLLHPNILGIFLAVLLPLTIGMFLVRTSRLVRFCFVLASGINLLALILTLSRSSWASFAAGFAVLLASMFFHPTLRRRSMMATAGAVIALAIGVIAFYGPITARLFDSREDATAGREVFREDAVRLINSAPLFGSGMNAYVYNVREFMSTRPDKYEGGWIPPVHEIYYLWLAETGWVGLSVFLFMWGWIIWYGILNFSVRDDLLYTINAGAVCGLIGFIVDGFLSFTLRVTPTLKEFWCLAALIMAVYYWRQRKILETRMQADGLLVESAASEALQGCDA